MGLREGHEGYQDHLALTFPALRRKCTRQRCHAPESAVDGAEEMLGGVAQSVYTPEGVEAIPGGSFPLGRIALFRQCPCGSK
jgi:hypothetical protein